MSDKQRLIALAAAIFTLSGVAAYQHARAERAGWREVAWPFPRDGWPAGRAFHCAVAACGEEIELYLRPKIGFCNCERGVADDDEVDRVADLDLLSERFVPLEAGRPIQIADMSGRARAYVLNLPDGSRHTAIGFALSRRCDLLVAAARGEGTASGVRRVALDFLGSDDVARWMVAVLDGG